MLLLALQFALGSHPLLANPYGGTVVAGGAQIENAGSVLNVSQSTDRAIIHWQGFSVAGHETTNFLQPSSTAAVLNRVTSAEASQILGTLNANGQVYLINPNGILVGNGAVVNVGSFVASTANVADQAFMEGGALHFIGATDAAIENRGTIHANSGDVVLLARTVKNEGMIRAGEGTAALLAGKDFYLKKEQAGAVKVKVESGATGETVAVGVDQRGTIEAVQARLEAAGNVYALAINQAGIIRATGVSHLPDGTVVLAAPGGKILQSGMIAALNQDGSGGRLSISGRDITAEVSSILTAAGGGNNGTGGQIEIAAENDAFLNGRLDVSAGDGAKGGRLVVTGERVGLFGGKVDASGGTGGGQVLLGGDYQGKNPMVRNASRTYVAPEAVIEADATVAGDGGTIINWSDLGTQFYGAASARGGVVSGNGGLVEVSGRDFLDYQGFVDALAPQGLVGTLLLDPTDMTIISGSSLNNTVGSGTFAAPWVPNGSGSTLGWDNINTALGTAAVFITTSNSPDTPGQTGAITISASSPVLNRANSLTITAAPNANIVVSAGSTISNSGNGGGLTLATSGSGQIQLGANITLGANGVLNLSGPVILTAAVTLTTGNGGSMTFSGAVDGNSSTVGRNLTIAANNGTVNFVDSVGGSVPLGAISFTSVGNLTFSGAIQADSLGGAFTNAQLVNFSSAQTYGAYGSAIGLNVTADQIIASGNITTLAGSGANVSLTADAGSLLVTGAISSANNISLSTNTGTGTTLTLQNSLTAAGTVTLAARTILTLGSGADINASGDVTLTGLTSIQTAADITASGSDITFSGASGDTNLTGDVVLSTGAGIGDITFNRPLTASLSTHDLELTAGTGTISFAQPVGGTLGATRLGDITIRSAAGVTFSSSLYAASLTQEAGVGGTTLLVGLSNFNGATGVNLTADAISVEGAMTVSSGGVTLDAQFGSINITATITILSSANLDFTATAGIVLGANLTTTSGNMAFRTATALNSSDVTLNTGGGSVTFGATFDGSDQKLTIAAGTGSGTVNFTGAVSDIGQATGAALEINSSGLVTFGNTVTGNGGIVSTSGSGSTRFNGNVTLAASGTGSSFAGPVTLSGISWSGFNGLTMSGAVTFLNNPVSFNSNGGAILFGSTLTGNNQNLTIAAGTAGGTVTFQGAVTGVGSGAGAAITLASTGAVTFASTVSAASGIVSSAAGGSTVFQGNVSLGDGDTASSFAGAVTLDGLDWSGHDGLTVTGTTTLSSGAVTLLSNNGSISFGGTVNGGQNLTVTAGTGNITFSSAVGGSTRLGDVSLVSAAAVNLDANFTSRSLTSSSTTFDSAGFTINTGAANENGGNVSLTTTGQLTTGTITTSGGNPASGAGKNAGTVGLTGGDVNAGAINAKGSAAFPTSNANGGTGGAVTLNATDATPTIILSGDIDTSGGAGDGAGGIGAGANVLLSDPVTLAANRTITTGSTAGDITFSSSLAGAGFTLGLTAGTGDILFSGPVGASSAALGTVTINSVRNLTLQQAIFATVFQQLVQGTGIFQLNAALVATSTTAPTVVTINSVQVDLNAGITSTGKGISLATGSGGLDLATGVEIATAAGANTGTASGSVTISTSSGGSIQLAGTINTSGSSNNAGVGSNGGTVNVSTDGEGATLAISGSINTTGGASSSGANGGAAGSVTLGSVSTQSINLTGSILAVGGSSVASGTGGIGGTVSLTAQLNPTASISLAGSTAGTITTSGGAATGSGTGGLGGNITLDTAGGTITLSGTTLTAAGGASSTTLGTGGAISIQDPAVAGNGTTTTLNTGNRGGSITFSELATGITGGGNLVLTTGLTSGVVSLQKAVVGDLTITAGDEITFGGGANSIQATGAILLQAAEDADTATSMGVGGAAGAVEIDDADLLALKTGATSLTIGRADQKGKITVGTATFRIPTLLRSNTRTSVDFPTQGIVQMDGLITGSDNASITVEGVQINLNAGITTAGNDITLTGSSNPLLGTVGTVMGAAIQLISQSGAILVSGPLDAGGFGLTLQEDAATSTGSVTLAGAISNLPSLTTFSRNYAVAITGGGSLGSAGMITFLNTGVLTLGASGVTTTFANGVTADAPSAVQTAGTITATVGNIDFSGTSLNVIGDTTLTVGSVASVIVGPVSGDASIAANAGTLSLNGNVQIGGNLTATADTINLASSGLQIRSTGAGTVTLRPLTAGRAVFLGSATGTGLILESALTQVFTAGRVVVGQAGTGGSGAITLAGALDLSGQGYGGFSLLSNGADVTFVSGSSLTLPNNTDVVFDLGSAGNVNGTATAYSGTPTLTAAGGAVRFTANGVTLYANVGQLQTSTYTGGLYMITTGAVNVNGSQTAGGAFGLGLKSGSLTLSAPIVANPTSINPNAVVLATLQNFYNLYGTTAVNPGDGRAIIYSQSPSYNHPPTGNGGMPGFSSAYLQPVPALEPGAAVGTFTLGNAPVGTADTMAFYGPQPVSEMDPGTLGQTVSVVVYKTAVPGINYSLPALYTGQVRMGFKPASPAVTAPAGNPAMGKESPERLKVGQNPTAMPASVEASALGRLRVGQVLSETREVRTPQPLPSVRAGNVTLRIQEVSDGKLAEVLVSGIKITAK